MVTQICVNNGSGNGLVPDDTKPLPEPMLMYLQKVLSSIHQRKISQEVFMSLIYKVFGDYTLNRVSTGSENGLSPIRHQAIIQINAGILLIRPKGTNFSENRLKIQKFSFMKMLFKMSSAKWQPFFPGGDELSKSPGNSLHLCGITSHHVASVAVQGVNSVFDHRQ